MSDAVKQRMWDLLRPIYGPVTRGLRRRLGRGYFEHPEMELPPPYEAVQLDVERHLHQYLHVAPEDISQIVIVGAHEADEVHRMWRSYPKAHFLCCEPNPRTYARLRRKFAADTRVTLSNQAMSNFSGKARFYELEMPGNGSLLQPDVDDWARVNQARKSEATAFEVNVSTLDIEAAALTTVDLLWMDVQGAEGDVIKGAAKVLERTRAVFLEVALAHSPYTGALLFPEISAILQGKGFCCVGLGTDAWNGNGNALFVKRFESLILTPARTPDRG